MFRKYLTFMKVNGKVVSVNDDFENPVYNVRYRIKWRKNVHADAITVQI